MAFLSGAFFPLDFAPSWLQKASNFVPLKPVNEGLMDVLVRGQGVGALLIPTAILLAFGFVVGLIAVRLFRWDADPK